MKIIHHSYFCFHVRVCLSMSPELRTVVQDTGTPFHIDNLREENDRIPFANTFCTKSLPQKQLSKPTQCEKISLCSEKIPPLSDNQGEIGNCRLRSNSCLLARFRLIGHQKIAVPCASSQCPVFFRHMKMRKKKKPYSLSTASMISEKWQLL